jgi:hypothetical protein
MFQVLDGGDLNSVASSTDSCGLNASSHRLCQIWNGVKFETDSVRGDQACTKVYAASDRHHSMHIVVADRPQISVHQGRPGVASKPRDKCYK